MIYEKIVALTVNSNNYIFAGTYWDGVYRSADNCKTWTQMINGLTDMYVRCFAVNIAGDIFVGTASGGIFRSDNDGASWQEKNNGLPGKIVEAITINNQEHLFVSVFMNGVYKSEDNGESWMPAKEGLTQPINSFAINSSGYIFGSTLFGGVYLSTNNGVSWSQINSGLSVLDVTFLTVNSSDQLFAGTYVSGIFRSINSTTGGIESESLAPPSEFILRQNYPNPFNATTNIIIELPKTSDVSINIYNINGQLIRTILREKKSAGIHMIKWHASNLPSATYFIRFKTKDYVKVKKCILLK